MTVWNLVIYSPICFVLLEKSMNRRTDRISTSAKNKLLLTLNFSEGSLNSSDSVSDSSPPPAVVQTGVPTQVVQQVQTAQQVKHTYSREISFYFLIKLFVLIVFPFNRGQLCRPHPRFPKLSQALSSVSPAYSLCTSLKK